jgi:hypothetical protein
MNAPQSVTERYVSNLLHYGRNKEFDIASVNREIHTHDNICVSVYFTVIVIHGTTYKSEFAAGATVQQATRRALEKHGVTFR